MQTADEIRVSLFLAAAAEECATHFPHGKTAFLLMRRAGNIYEKIKVIEL